MERSRLLIIAALLLLGVQNVSAQFAPPSDGGKNFGLSITVDNDGSAMSDMLTRTAFFDKGDDAFDFFKNASLSNAFMAEGSFTGYS